MSETTQITLDESIQEILTPSEDTMDFTLAEHREERIKFHTQMLNYYLTEDYESRRTSPEVRTEGVSEEV